MGVARPWLRTIAVVTALAANVLAQVLSAITGDYGPRPAGLGWGVVFIVVAVDYLAGAVIVWRTVSNPVPGWLMVGAALFWSAGAWYPLARGIGWLWPLLAGLTDLWAVLVGVLVLSYPSGVIRGRFDRAVVLITTVVFLARFVGILLFAAPDEAACGCVPNSFAVLPSASADYGLGIAWRAAWL